MMGGVTDNSSMTHLLMDVSWTGLQYDTGLAGITVINIMEHSIECLNTGSNPY